MRIRNLSKIYKGKYDTVKALDDMSLNFDEKGLTFIVGVSGSGKSTLMNMLSGIDKPSVGEVLIGGKSLYDKDSGELFGYRNSYVGLIFQDYNLIEDLSVYENIKLPLELLGETDFSVVDEVMKKVDIEEIRDSRVYEISSGQMQRVAIARALVKNSNIILADEPTGNLDTTNGDLVLSILKEVSQEKLVIVITHDDAAALKFGDRIIEIEDGKVLKDSRPKDDFKADEQLITKEPVLTLKKQIEFTVKFMKQLLSRSLTIFLLMLLVPVIGAVLAGYGFFNIGKSYIAHQEKYNEEYAILAMNKKGYNVYYDTEQYVDVFNKYPRSTFTQVFNTYIPITTEEVQFGTTSLNYSNSIDHVIIYKDGFFDIDGAEPTDTNEVVVTDYVMACISEATGEEPETIKIFGYTYNIVGVANTNYEEFLKADMSDEFTLNAFNSNMYAYSAIIMNEYAYGDETDSNSFVFRAKYFTDTLSFTAIDGVTVVNDLDVTVYRGSAKSVNLYSVRVNGYPKLARGCVYVSSALAKAFGYGTNYNNVVGKRTPGLTLSGRSRILCSFYIGGVFNSDKYEIIMDDGVFTQSDFYKYAITKVGDGRILVKNDDVNYKDIICNENVVNASFTYASSLNDTIISGRISIFEILFSIIVILIAFGGFINSYTLSQEKKKIGIKYSLGLSRSKIVLPYILEYVFDIAIGAFAAILAAKVLYPLIMNIFVNRTAYDKMVFSFFYISWGTILGWIVLVAMLMMTSLYLMIRKIMAKSPVEIIKDL